ncbi:MAG: hypothetical protein WBW81_02020, partial [Methylocella sp.]
MGLIPAASPTGRQASGIRRFAVRVRPGAIASAEAASRRIALALCLVLCLALFVAACLAAQSVQPAAPDGDEKGELSGRRLELQGMEDTLEASQDQRRRIEAEIASIRADRAKLTAALLDATQIVNASERKIGATEARLDSLTGAEDAIKRSLASRRAVIAEILASLQRMGRKPPPALLVAPEDMLAAIRTSMLLGSVLPQMHGETEALASDLSDLVRLRQSIAAERETLA